MDPNILVAVIVALAILIVFIVVFLAGVITALRLTRPPYY